jgi:ABC-type multidrug transport system ATPase subunit
MELEFQGISKTYQSKQALRDISFTFTEGIYGLLGPNGAGKSTLMNILAGNLTASSGQVLYNGEDTVGMGQRFKAKLGYMPQQQAMYPNFTVMRFMGYMAALRGLKKEEAQRQIEDILEEVELLDQARSRIHTLSGGMKQRLLIAQALLGHPDILILDEPTAGLDPRQRILIRNLIAKLSIHKIVIIATHVVTDVEYIAKQILILNQGQIIQMGSPEQLASSVTGKVFEVSIDEEQLGDVSRRFQVENITRHGARLNVRILSPTQPTEFCPVDKLPNLEDAYLWYCGE